MGQKESTMEGSSREETLFRYEIRKDAKGQ
jgi:hypothetical protein